MPSDSKGVPLAVGDRVWIAARVTALLPGHPLFDVEVETELPEGDGYHPRIGLNARQLRKERRGRPKRKAVISNQSAVISNQ